MFVSKRIPTEPLYHSIKPHEWEIELFHSRPVRRLKHLSHFGAGSLITPIVHSRYEHTVGVWKLAAYFFPDDIKLRIACILHDVGHLPFSHAMEAPLGFDHHSLAESYIQTDDIAAILKQVLLTPEDIISFLKKPSALTGSAHILGIDHLDSFLRDTYMLGLIDTLPHDVLSKLTCTEKGIEAEHDTGLYLLKLILGDHKVFLSPMILSVDRLLAEAIAYHWDEDNESSRTQLASLTDNDVISLLKHSKSKEANHIIHTLLYEPDKIQINGGSSSKSIPINTRRVYAKTPLLNGKPLIEQSDEALYLYNNISSLSHEFEETIEK